MSLSGSVPKSQENSSRSGIKLLFSRLLSLFLNLMATFSKFSRESQIKSAFRKKTNPRILIRLKKIHGFINSLKATKFLWLPL